MKPHRLLGHLAVLRRSNSKSLWDIELDTGIPHGTIRSWELGSHGTRIRNLDVYADYWGLTVELVDADRQIVVPQLYIP